MLTVLIVDDDRNIIKMLDFAFQKAGFTVLVARDGAEGLAVATEHPPDVALLDVMMPNIHGYELCRRLRATPRTAHVKIIFLTARSQPIDQQEGIKAGADLFLSKPVPPDELVAVIRQLASTARRSPSTQAEPGPEGASGNGEAPAAYRAQEDEVDAAAPVLPSRGRLVVCWGGSPGVGVTTLAANLALGLALYRRAETPLVELHPVPSGLLPKLGIEAGPPYGDLAGAGSLLNWDILSLHLLDHPSGVRALPAPPEGSDVSPALTGRAVSLLRARFPLILADAASDLDARVQPVLLSSDIVLLVIVPEVQAIRSALDAIHALHSLEYPTQQIVLVINDVRPHSPIPVKRIQEGLQKQVLAVLPHEPALALSIETGAPLLLANPTAPYSQAVGRLAMKLERAFAHQSIEQAPSTP
jgi:pilus assembly protein CpaE